jgi:hypothetical protein
MAEEQVFSCSAYPVNNSYREQTVYFAYPEEINRETGMMLLISGFGSNPEADTYKEMRKMFAEEHNLVVIQSTYLGMEFMGDINEAHLDSSQLQELQRVLPDDIKEKVFLEKARLDFTPLMDPSLPFTLNITTNMKLDETEDNFAEMGPIQAIDCVRALQLVYEIIRDNGYEINLDRVIAYGHAHGAYLAHLCNRFFPDLFSFMLDIGAWISPAYLRSPRFLLQKINNLWWQKIFTYRITSQQYDPQLYDLGFLYHGFDNKANIVVYQGVTDNFVKHEVKQRIFNPVRNVIFNVITPDKVDGMAIRSTNNGDVNLIELFRREVRENGDLLSIKGRKNPFDSVQYVKTRQNTYMFDFFNGSPRIEVVTNLN